MTHDDRLGSKNEPATAGEGRTGGEADGKASRAVTMLVERG